MLNYSEKNMTDYADVAVNTPSFKTFHYLIPPNLKDKLRLYQRVVVPLKKSKQIGYIINFPKISEVKGLKYIESAYDPFPIITKDLFKLALWIGDEYCASLGMTLHTMFPPRIKTIPPKYGKFETLKDKVDDKTSREDSSEIYTVEAQKEKRLNIYLQNIEKYINNNKSVLLVVPEISSLEFFEKVIKDRFNIEPIKFHSKLSSKDRFLVLSKILSNNVKIVIGTRQSIFLPVVGLKLIIVEEENSNSYFSDETPKFNTCKVVVKRAEIEGINVILGSYSLSLESRCKYETLFSEIASTKDIKIVSYYNKNKIVSSQIDDMVKEDLNNNEKIIFITTRKGYSTSIYCEDCGYVFQCEKCGMSLVFYKEDNSLRCRYCRNSLSLENKCPNCHGVFINSSGFGIEKVELEVKKNFDKYLVQRVDTEVIKKDSLKKDMLNRFIKDEINIIVGTQFALNYLKYLKKGTVVILGFDYLLNIPTFNSSELAVNFLLSIVDRVSADARIILQVKNEKNFSINNLEEFWMNELKSREQLNYPPYSRLGLVTIKNKDEKKVKNLANLLKEIIKEKLKESNILGPAFVNRVKGYYNYQLLLKNKDSVGVLLKDSITEFETQTRVSKKYINIEIF
ncbi:MAG: primosomal protein N' [Candidatus Firestonebacteria bacterium]